MYFWNQLWQLSAQNWNSFGTWMTALERAQSLASEFSSSTWVVEGTSSNLKSGEKSNICIILVYFKPSYLVAGHIGESSLFLQTKLRSLSNQQGIWREGKFAGRRVTQNPQNHIYLIGSRHRFTTATSYLQERQAWGKRLYWTAHWIQTRKIAAGYNLKWRLWENGTNQIYIKTTWAWFIAGFGNDFSTFFHFFPSFSLAPHETTNVHLESSNIFPCVIPD